MDAKNKKKILEWFIESKVKGGSLKSSDLPAHSVPRWIGLAQKVLKSPKFSEKVKTYWRKRLTAYCKKNPKSSACKKGK